MTTKEIQNLKKQYPERFIVLGRNDLYDYRKEKPINEIGVVDFKIHRDMILKAIYILFVDKPFSVVLKDRLKIGFIKL